MSTIDNLGQMVSLDLSFIFHSHFHQDLRLHVFIGLPFLSLDNNKICVSQRFSDFSKPKPPGVLVKRLLDPSPRISDFVGLVEA